MLKTPPYDVLVVASEAATIRLITSYFKSKGYTCKGVDSGAKALIELNLYSPKVILLDESRDCSIFELFKNIKSIETIKNVPIYFLKSKTEKKKAVRNSSYDEDVVNFIRF